MILSSPKIKFKMWICELEMVKISLGYLYKFWFGQIHLFHIYFGFKPERHFTDRKKKKKNQKKNTEAGWICALLGRTIRIRPGKLSRAHARRETLDSKGAADLAMDG